MLWDLRYQRDGFSIEAALRKGRSLPDWYTKEPYIDSSGIFYISCFWNLNSTRRFDMGFIPWDIQLKCAEYVGLDQDNIEGFIAIISKLDHAYLKWVASERKNKSG